MKMTKLLNRERIIILAVGGLILLVGAVYRFIPDIQAFSDQGKAQQFVKYQKKAGELPVLEERLIVLTAGVEKLAAHLISSQSNELAGVEVQNLLRDMAGREQIGFRSIKAVNPDLKTYAHTAVIPVTLVFPATIRQLRNFLHQIETSAKLLAVSDLRISRPGTGNSDNLNVVMTVEGFSIKQG